MKRILVRKTDSDFTDVWEEFYDRPPYHLRNFGSLEEALEFAFDEYKNIKDVNVRVETSNFNPLD